MTMIVELLTNVSRNYIMALAVTVFLVVEVIKLTDCLSPKVLPVIAGVVGIMIGCCVGVIFDEELVKTGLNEFIAGLLAAGSVDFAKAVWHLPEVFK
ncbi:hypothetical protein [uncultured Vagococcus sp.]|uniref:hypothetical protein n=1 Tax=uncultured Vagococcus sp. TaxID=189676 RepID=UPI0028D40CA7|nr:hypothetical protein [uncultured Vagococcus sp.]